MAAAPCFHHVSVSINQPSSPNPTSPVANFGMSSHYNTSRLAPSIWDWPDSAPACCLPWLLEAANFGTGMPQLHCWQLCRATGPSRLALHGFELAFGPFLVFHCCAGSVDPLVCNQDTPSRAEWKRASRLGVELASCVVCARPEMPARPSLTLSSNQDLQACFHWRRTNCQLMLSLQQWDPKTLC
jgi:hypothetical protein